MKEPKPKELFEIYQAELAGQYGFGAPSMWTKGPRNFAAFLANRKRIEENLAYIEAHPTAHYPKGWIKEVQDEALQAGLRWTVKPCIGSNCRPGIDKGIVYGGDLVDAF